MKQAVTRLIKATIPFRSYVTCRFKCYPFLALLSFIHKLSGVSN